MNSKLLIGFVVAMFVCCAQAGIEKFGNLGTGEEGFYKRCFTKMSLSSLMEAYQTQRAGNMLDADRKEVDANLDAKFASFGGSSACSRNCYDILNHRVSASIQEGEKDLDTSRCRRLARFDRLCKLVRQQNSADRRVQSIENWLCLTSEVLERAANSSGYFRCQEIAGYPDSFEKEAEKELETVLSYSLEELKKEDKQSADEIATSNDLRRAIDGRIVLEAYSKVFKGMDKLPKYIECSKKERESSHLL